LDCVAHIVPGKKEGEEKRKNSQRKTGRYAQEGDAHTGQDICTSTSNEKSNRRLVPEEEKRRKTCRVTKDLVRQKKF